MIKSSRAVVKKVFIGIGYFFAFVVPQLVFWFSVSGVIPIENEWAKVFVLFFAVNIGAALMGELLFGNFKFYQEKMEEDWQYSHTEIEAKYDTTNDKVTFTKYNVYEDKNAFVRILIYIGLLLLSILCGAVVFIVKLIMLILA